MAVDATALQARFSEFTDTPTSLIDSVIAEALSLTPADIWGDLQDTGVLYLAAHLLALSPQARDMRLEGGETTYGKRRQMLELIVSSGYRVVGVEEPVIIEEEIETW